MWPRIAKMLGMEVADPVPFGDFVFRQGFDNVSSTIKARQAGFHACTDSQAMFAQLFEKFRQMNLLPTDLHGSQ